MQADARLLRSAEQFAPVLKEVAAVFALDRDCLNIFADVSSNRIAFNRGGCLFFNLRYLLPLVPWGLPLVP